ncbi:MAG: AAA family ATPase [Sedimentisphaerales bacterium]
MEISEIVIKDFMGIEKVEMRPIKPINVLIGRNNSGKSSILAALEYVSKCWDANKNIVGRNPIVEEQFRLEGSERKKPVSVSITVMQSKEEQQKQWGQIVNSWNSKYNTQFPRGTEETLVRTGLLPRTTFKFVGEIGERDFSISTVLIGGPQLSNDIVVLWTAGRAGDYRGIKIEGLVNSINSPRGLEEAIRKFGSDKQQDGITMNRQLTGGREPWDVVRMLFWPAYEQILKTLGSAFLINAYRHASDYGGIGGEMVLDAGGANLVSYLTWLFMNRNAQFRRIIETVKRVVPEIGRLHSRTQGGQLELACEWETDEIVRLVRMGGGLEQILMFVCFLLDKRRSCLLWEEPETHLHPGAQDVLLNILEEEIGTRTIFLTTHSPVFVRDSDKIAVHVLSNLGGRSASGRTLMEKDFRDAVNVIGSRPGHLAQADIVVYVEGKSGAAAVEEWLGKWPDKKKTLKHLILLVQPINADEMGTEDFQLDGLKKVTSNMIIFVDKDNEAGADEPKKARKVLMDKCQKEGIPCIITEKRKVEDYFTESAVKQTLPSNLLKGWVYDPEKPMGEQLESGWKRHNRGIAAAMDWKDVENHKDVMKIFDEIGNYAGRLMPASEH